MLNCSYYSDDMIDIIKAFHQIGWVIYDSQDKVEYLPVGDDDEYNWRCERMSEKDIYEIISMKKNNKEQIGIKLYNNSRGVSLVASDTTQIMLSISINRKLVKEKHTDMVWYIENIIYKLLNIGVDILAYSLEEFED